MMAYTLRDDRTVEYGYVEERLPEGDGLLLDVGTPQGYPTPQMAAARGWRVIAVDLMARDADGERIRYRRGDLLTVPFDPATFDYVLNISSVEHFGLAGRYTVAEDDTDADLKAMRRLWELMKPRARMLLTVPVGVDTVVYPLHRVYGQQRLPRLLAGFYVENVRYYAKFHGIDTYQPTDRATALSTAPRCADPASQRAADHYYAIGCFQLVPQGRQ
jgi:SAM-dependent methyltransferase